jgi:Tfp pilus assembly protein PilF
MFTKEIAFTLPLAALLCEASFFRGPWRPRLLALAPLLLTLAIIPLLVLTSGELSVEGTLRQARLDIPRTHYLLTQFPVMVTYLRLLIWPAGQNIDYDYPIYTTFFTPPVFFSFLLLTALLACAGWLFHKSSPQPPVPELRLIAFGICWFFLTLAIEAGVVPLPDVIFEHRLYLPSVGLAAALAVTLVLAAQKTAHLAGGRLPLLAATAAIIALGAATWQRNQVWGSEVSLWQDTVNKSPGKVRPLYNYGTYLADHGQPAAALPMLGKVVALDPQHADAWHNLGRAHLLLGQTSEAVPALRTAARLAPHLDNALLNLTSALIRSGEYREAIELLAGARQRTAILPGVLMNLGLAYAALGELAAARGELAALQRLDPNMARTLADVIARAAPAR